MSRAGKRRQPDTRQLTLGAWFEVPRAPEPHPGALAGLDQELRGLLSRCLKETPQSRYEVAARMSELLGAEVSKHMLDAYTAESRETHQLSAVRLVALVLATGSHVLLDLLAARCGCRLLIGEEAIGAELGFIDQEIEALRAKRAELKRLAPHRLAPRRRA